MMWISYFKQGQLFNQTSELFNQKCCIEVFKRKLKSILLSESDCTFQFSDVIFSVIVDIKISFAFYF